MFRASASVAATIAAVTFFVTQAGAAGPPQVAWASWINVAADTTNASTFVAANGATTTVRFDYALTGSGFCTNLDGSGTGSSSTPAQTLDASSPGMIVGAPISGLTPGATYCATAVAANANGTTRSDFGTFVAGAPSANSDDVEATGAQTAIVTGSANAAGQANATVRLDYGAASSQWCTADGATGSAPSHTAVQPLGAADAADHAQAVAITGLTPGQDYCAAIVAATSAATSAVGGTVAFTAGSPSADTASVAVTGATTVTVAGSVDPSAQQTTYKAEYDTDASLYCQDPDNNIPAHSTVPVVLPATDTSAHPVTVDIAGLTAGAGYCARITATNGSGIAVTGPIDFVAGASTVATGSVTVTGATTADIAGTVDPGGSSTSYSAEFDTADSAWCQGTDGATPAHATTPQPLGASDTSDHPVVVGLTGLAAGTSYCADIHATNAGGAFSGDQVSFTAAVPVVTTSRAFSTAATTAEVDGSVNPSGQQTSVAVGYDLAGSPWCVSRTGSPAHTTASTSLGQTDTTAHAVTVSLSGLTTGTQYCAAIIATNAVAVTSGPKAFTAGAPVVSEADATALGPTSERIAGGVAAAGQAGTTYNADYAPGNSQFCQSAGAAGAATTTAAVPLGFADTDSHPVTVDLTGLTPGVSYCWRIDAANGTTATGLLHEFTAGLVQAATVPPSTLGATRVTLAGRVNGENLPTTFRFEWDSGASQWCASNGGTGEAAHSTTEQPLGITDTNAHAVTRQVTGLSGGTDYCYRLRAQNPAGSARGEVVAFRTATPGSGGGGGAAPTVTTGAATEITAATANLHGTLNPNGSPTAYHFEYGRDAAYGSATPTQDAGAGSDAIPAAAPVAGLTPSTEYHFRLVAESDAGRSEGPDMTFTTSAPAHDGGGGGGAGLPGLPGTIFVHTSQVSRRLDRVTGNVVIGEDDSTFQAQVLWAGKLARVNVVGRLVMRGLRRGVVPFTVRLNARARRTFKPKRRVALMLRTTVSPRTGTPIARHKRVVLRRGH